MWLSGLRLAWLREPSIPALRGPVRVACKGLCDRSIRHLIEMPVVCTDRTEWIRR